MCQRVGVCWSVLLCIGSVLEYVEVCWSVLECVGVCWSVLQCVAVCLTFDNVGKGLVVHRFSVDPFWLLCVSVCCSVLQCVAVYRSVL